MDKDVMDKLYHMLREVSNESAEDDSGELASVVFGMAKHLLAGGDYLKLVQYCKYYGSKFLLAPMYQAIVEKDWKPTRIVELGAGLGWLGRGLAAKFDLIPALFVDKRPWGLIDVVADLETPGGIYKVQKLMKEGDVIVMSDFLHCIEDPESILKAFSEYPMATLEYMPADKDHASSYVKQLARFGGNPISAEELTSILSKLDRTTEVKDLEPYVLILIDKEV